MSLFKKLFANSAITAIILVSGFSVWLAGNLGAFGINKIVFDVVIYHSYTPALFIEKDLSLIFYKNNRDYYFEKGMYWASETPDGKPIIKTTYGLSLMNLPFTIWPILFDSENKLNGYELPFSIAIGVANLFYFIIALFALYKLLLKLGFSKNAIAFTVFCITIGTNVLTYSSVTVGMPHIYNFSILVFLLYFIVLWHEHPNYKYSIAIGLLIGLLILIRPTNILFGLCLLFFKKPVSKINFIAFIKQFKFLLLMALCAFLIVVPQLLYWKHVTGHYFFNSYVGEKFYFNNPHLPEYIFGFRKGWLLYSPLLVLAIVGLFLNKAKNPFLISTIIIVGAFVFLNSSWWCWWFGGGHGGRAMIETYPLLAIGFASAFEHFTVVKRKVLIGLASFLILFNIKSVDLYRANIIHYDSMTYKAFVYTTFKLTFSDEDKAYLETLYVKPNYDKALRGEDT